MNAVYTARTGVNAALQDSDVLHKVRKALTASGYPQLRRVCVNVHAGVVTLRGAVSTYYQKQIAQETARNIDGVDNLHNEMIVR